MGSIAREMTSMDPLQLRLKKTLSSRGTGTFLLDVEFEVGPGITILFGPSGSGKTTILQCVAGLLKPDEGSISVGDQVLFDTAANTDVPVSKRNTGYVFQNLALFPHLSVEENIHYGLKGLTRQEMEERTQAVLESFRVPHLLHRRPDEISGGERQRVALARSLVMHPRVLLLDEPLSALDGVTKSKIMDDLRAWNDARKIPIVYVTHGRREVFSLGERVVALERGKVIAQGTPQEVLAAPRHEMLAQLAGFENIFDSTVVAHYESHGTMACRLERRITAKEHDGPSPESAEARESAVIPVSKALELEVPLARIEPGANVRVAIRAGDILLSSQVPQALSARNVLIGNLTSLNRVGVMVVAEVDCGVPITVDLTPSAVESLGLKIGQQVWLIIKTYSCHLLHRRSEDIPRAPKIPPSGTGAPPSNTSSYPRLKVLYLIAVTALAFAVPAWHVTASHSWYIVPGLLGLQFLILLAANVEPVEIFRSATRLKWLFVFLLGTYLLLPSDSQATDAIFLWKPLANFRTIALNVTGAMTAALMCLQIMTVILVSAVVRLTGSGTDLVDGLRGFGFPKLFVYSIDYTLALLGGLRKKGTGSGGGRGRMRSESADTPRGFARIRQQASEAVAVIKRMLSGDVTVFTQSIQQNMERAESHVVLQSEGKLDSKLAHDVAAITGISLVMMSLKMLRILPGIPFFSGYKTLLLYPLYILAADLTYSRWGGTVCGTIMGVLGFMQGDGRYGAMEILKHTAPGFVVDLGWPLLRRMIRRESASGVRKLVPIAILCIFGLVLAVARTSTEFVTVLLIRSRDAILLFPAAKLIPNVIAGTLSGFITYFVLIAFRGAEAADKSLSPAPAAELSDAAAVPAALMGAATSGTPSGAGSDRGGGGGGGRGQGGGGGRGR
jgi:ABC-type molybdate transport system, ATPase component